VTNTVSPTPSASAAPALPSEAQQPTREGAEAFARYYFAVYNHAFLTADPSLLKELSDGQCIFCNSTISAVQDIHDQNEHVIGGRITVTSAVAAEGIPTDRIVVNLRLDQDAGQTLSRTGVVDDTTPAQKGFRVDLAVRWITDRWIFLNAHFPKAGEP
jgi:hypothetical protein